MTIRITSPATWITLLVSQYKLKPYLKFQRGILKFSKDTKYVKLNFCRKWEVAHKTSRIFPLWKVWRGQAKRVQSRVGIFLSVGALWAEELEWADLKRCWIRRFSIYMNAIFKMEAVLWRLEIRRKKRWEVRSFNQPWNCQSCVAQPTWKGYLSPAISYWVCQNTENRRMALESYSSHYNIWLCQSDGPQQWSVQKAVVLIAARMYGEDSVHSMPIYIILMWKQ